MNSKRRAKRPVIIPLTAEPLVVSDEEVLERLGSMISTETPENRKDEATLRALHGLGLVVVRKCDLCAESLTGRIPACPNVATVTVKITQGRTIFGGELHICGPHARGEKVYARKDYACRSTKNRP